MLKNYFTIILRNLWRNKLYSLINIIGLGVGIATLVWGIQNYRYSFSYDKFHKNRNQVFRVLTQTPGTDFLRGSCPAPIAVLAKNDFPVVAEAIRWESRGLNIKAPQSEPFEAEADFTDPGFFELFDFPLIEGTANLKDPSTLLLTHSAAKKYFGNSDPVGKTLVFYSDETFSRPLTITGVLKDPPLNSSIQFELITNFENDLKPDGTGIKKNDWSWFADAVFLRLSDPSQASNLSGELKRYLPLQQSARPELKIHSFSLETIAQSAIDTKIYNNALSTRPPDSATYGPLVLAFLILLSSCLNFANTSVAQSNRRLKEMGVRKVMGSTIRQIVFQQLLECGLIVILATGLSIILNIFWLPVFNAMFTNVHVTAEYLRDYTLLSILLSVGIGVTLLAGTYPAFYISRFNAANIFRGSVKFGGSNLFSRILLGFQISISFITVIAGMAFSRNSEFQRTYDYGYEKANIIGLDLQSRNRYQAVRDELGKIPGINGMAGTINHIQFSYHRIPLEAKGEKWESIYLETGDHYTEVMNLKLVAGRPFQTGGTADYGQSMLINEKLAFLFGWTPKGAIGQPIRVGDSSQFTVVGVLKDFEQNTLFDAIQPVALVLARPENYSQIIIRADPGSVSGVYSQVRAAWSRLYPMKPVRAYYQDRLGAEASGVNESIATIFSWFALISMIMAATGMFALVSLTVLKRTKEIAIRKVVGAKGRHIFQLVLKGYFWIFLLSAVFGCYTGYSLSRLLMDLIFKINSGVSFSSLWWSFLAVFGISAMTIGSRIWMVLRTRSTDVLKTQ
jgi:putative ABC transport system permease protein